MSLSNNDLDRIRAKLASFPPYDWEDDVAALLEALRHEQKAREAIASELQWTLRQANIMADALMRIAGADEIELVHRLARAAQVKARGEQ